MWPLGMALAVFCGWWLNDLRYHWASLPEFRFGYLVVMLTGYLVWERWPSMPKSDTPGARWVVAGLTLFGFAMVAVSELYRIAMTRTATTSMSLSLGCAAFVAAGVLALRGPATLKHFLFPLLFFFVAVPIPNLVWKPVVLALQALVTWFNVELLNVIGIPAEQQGSIIQLPNCRVGVDEACSGIRSLQSSIMAALFIGDLTLRRWGWKVFFLVAGVGLAVVGNIGRSLYLSLTAHRRGIQALEAVHDSAGWSVLLFTFVGLAVLAWLAIRLETAAVAHARRMNQLPS
jgi:exosortase